jgi:hypothetical protein
MKEIKVGDRVQTPMGRAGVVESPPGNEILPLHCLVVFPAGDRTWYLAKILTAIPEEKGQNGSNKILKGRQK